jgi:hypothetical protein
MGRLRLVGWLVLLSALWAAPPGASAATYRHPLCARLGHTIEASAGAQMFCFGPQPSGTASAGAPAAAAVGPNTNAASLAEDVSPAGVRGYGQSETSVAATGSYVMEAWNDATTFFSPCPSPMSKEEGTGLGFSADGGATFRDLGGAPNAQCEKWLVEGDPSVEAWRPGGHPYFYIASLYPSIAFNIPSNKLSLTVCKVLGSGATADVSCGQPIVLAASNTCEFGQGFSFCGFLDKEYLAIDPQRGRLYASYTEFGATDASVNGVIDLAVCDIGTPGGGTGPAGGTAAHPVCKHGTPATRANPNTSPYLTIAPGDLDCENEGAYPAVDETTGDVYVAYEFNVDSDIFNPSCWARQTRQVLKRVRQGCLTLTTVSPCPGPSGSATQAVVSMDAAFIPGYNRFPANDFPRIAADPSAGTVSIVWNDARAHPLGDILLRSYALGSLTPVQPAPVRLNHDTNGLHFLPAVRQASAAGRLGVTWYSRAQPDTSVTDVRGVVSLDPRLTAPPASSVLVTSRPSDWLSTSSDIVPDFGDYTDDYAAGGRLHVAWSDGRLGVPQPFHASTAMP